MEYVSPNKEICSKCAVLKRQIVSWRSDYYAQIPQILKPGDDSNIMISYGTINFEELEMKKYTGNVSFILNINRVDVTPSRENVIWNTKLEAVKECLSQLRKR
jgi:hypothetical protein